MVTTKDDITRKCLKKNIMKQVVLRVDYQGVSDIQNTLSKMDSFLQGYFKSREIKFANEMDITLPNPEEISSSLSIPVREIVKRPIYSYSNSDKFRDNLYLNVSEFNIDITIQCKDYKTIDDYLVFFINTIKEFKVSNPFLSFKRIGLRKISWEFFHNLEDSKRVFEKNMFFYNLSDFKLRNRKLMEQLVSSNDIFINFQRNIEDGKVRSAGGVESEAYRFILDLDAYLNESQLTDINLGSSTVDELDEKLRLMNSELFLLFKDSVTLEFLNSNMKK